MSSWRWVVTGMQDLHGTMRRGLFAEGVVEAEGGEEALHRLLDEVPGPWDELDSALEFTVTVGPVPSPGAAS